ncbi:MAG: hypothetical protein MHPSP_003398 [Paramarteilia canceri]
MKFVIILVLIGHIHTVNYYDLLYSRLITIDNDGLADEILELKEFKRNYFFDKSKNKFIQCSEGKATNSSTYKTNSCTGCTIYHKYLEINYSTFKCNNCSDGTIASFTNAHKNLDCDISYSDYKLTEIENNGKRNCSDILLDSIGREENTPPILDYCQCPNNMPRIRYNNLNNNKNGLINCLPKSKALEIIDQKGLDYVVDNLVQLDNELITYQNCDPLRDSTHSNSEKICLCPPNRIYSDGKCKLCTDSDPEETETKIRCVRCSKEKILTLDGKGCMCPYSDYPQSYKCNESTVNEKFCSGNFGLKDGKCQYCSENEIKSDITGECFCPAGKYINSEQKCVSCQKGKFSDSFNSNKCKKCPFLKTTKGFNSESQLLCEQLNKYHLVAVIISICSFFVLIFLITFFVVKYKANRRNEANHDRNHKSAHQYLNYDSAAQSTNNKLPIQFCNAYQPEIIDQIQNVEYVNYEVSKVFLENNENEEYQSLNQEIIERQIPESPIDKKSDKISSEGD